MELVVEAVCNGVLQLHLRNRGNFTGQSTEHVFIFSSFHVVFLVWMSGTQARSNRYLVVIKLQFLVSFHV